MKFLTRLCCFLSMAIVSLAAFQIPSYAAYPEKNINMIIPFTPGGGNDRITRCLDKHATKAFDKSFVFEYKDGAGGLIGTAYLETLKPDGYALGNINAPQLYAYATQKDSPVKIDGLTYLFQLSTEPMALVTPKDSPIKNWDEFLKYCKEHPGKLSLGIASGFNSSSGYAVANLQKTLGLKFNSIPLKGGADLNVNLLGNHVMAGMGNLSILLTEKDKLNFIAVTSPERSRYLPDVPTFKQIGVPISDQVRRLIVGPAGIDKAQQKEIIDRFKAVFDTPEMHEEMLQNGWEPDWLAGDELTKVINDEFKRYKEVMGK